MSRAALLPMPGDPVILRHFVDNFEKVWADEVDTLYILLNTDARMPQEIVDYDINYLKDRPKIVTLHQPTMLFQGAALRYMLPFIKEDLIMSIEDDTVIVKQGHVDSCFRRIEKDEADVVGSPRMCLSPQLADRMGELYNLDYTGYGDKGPVYWPNFFFCKKADLLRTDLHFEPKGWAKGDYIKELDMTAEGTLAGDVFVWLCIQLRAMGLRFYDINQYHSHPNDLEAHERGMDIFDGNCPWVHIGSLTMTAEDLVMGIGNVAEHRNKPKSDMEKKELERRYAWLTVFLEEAVNYTQEPGNFRNRYVRRMNEYISGFDLSLTHINNLVKVYRRFVAW